MVSKWVITSNPFTNLLLTSWDIQVRLNCHISAPWTTPNVASCHPPHLCHQQSLPSQVVLGVDGTTLTKLLGKKNGKSIREISPFEMLLEKGLKGHLPSSHHFRGMFPLANQQGTQKNIGKKKWHQTIFRQMDGCWIPAHWRLPFDRFLK